MFQLTVTERSYDSTGSHDATRYVDLETDSINEVFAKAKELIRVERAHRVYFETPDCWVSIESHTDIGYRILGKWK